MPDVDTTIAQFYSLLIEEPRRIDDDETVLREALGLSRAG